jgi:hypothetical protein
MARDGREGATRVLVPPAPPDPDVGEEAFLQLVFDLARALGWLAYHTRDSRRSAAGFPDLVLVRERLVFAELKVRRGEVSGAQRGWLNRLARCGQETYLWRPAQWALILEVLR